MLICSPDGRSSTFRSVDRGPVDEAVLLRLATGEGPGPSLYFAYFPSFEASPRAIWANMSCAAEESHSTADPTGEA